MHLPAIVDLYGKSNRCFPKIHDGLDDLRLIRSVLFHTDATCVDVREREYIRGVPVRRCGRRASTNVSCAPPREHTSGSDDRPNGRRRPAAWTSASSIEYTTRYRGLAALSDPTRLEIVRRLAERDEQRPLDFLGLGSKLLDEMSPRLLDGLLRAVAAGKN